MKKFEALNEEKKQKIMNACIKEFSLNGYDKASTNQMVKEAGISKGLLFHYFHSKKELFLYLYRYIMAVYEQEFIEYMKTADTDLFIRLKTGIKKKNEILGKYPLFFKFMETAFMETSIEVRDEIKDSNQMFIEYGESFFKDVDTSKLIDAYDKQEVINIIIWTLKGYESSMMQYGVRKDIKAYQNLLNQLDDYIKILKKIFYKEDKE